MADLTHASDDATQKTNKTGIMDRILVWEPDDGTEFHIAGSVPTGAQIGVPIYTRLYDSTGSLLPFNTEFAVQYKQAGDDDWTTVTKPFKNIGPYRRLSVEKQQNEKYIDTVKHIFKHGAKGLVVEDVEKVALAVKSSAAVDWSQGSEAIVEPTAVENPGE